MGSKKQLGQDYRYKTMYLLARLGYATTRQIAMAVWGRCDLSSRKMAGRTIRWLLAHGYIVEKRDGLADERLIALTKAGAAEVAHEMPLPGNRSHARDWLRHAHHHRTASNSVYAALAGYKRNLDVGMSELEIRVGEAPANLALFQYRVDGEVRQKIPDLLVDLTDNTTAWIEVENCWRGGKDFAKLIEFLRAIFNMPKPPVSAVWFVITSPGAKSIGKRIRAAMTHAENDFAITRQVKELDSRILEKLVRVLQLNVDTLELNPVIF